MRRYPERPLGEAIYLDVDDVPVSPMSSYEIAGVYSFGRGLFSRGRIQGTGTSYAKLNRLHEGRIVLSRLKAFEGAISIIGGEFNGHFLSPEFPTFSVLPGSECRYIAFLCRWPDFWKLLKKDSRGLGARRERVSAERVLDLKVPLPDHVEQRRIANKLDAIHSRISAADAGRETARRLRKTLRQVLVRSTSDSDRVRVRVDDIISLVRRPVNIAPEAPYREIGLRSFGRGVFHKAPVSGEEIANKKVYHIEPGDLLFSTVFAWEGAVALASEKESGFIGSHRFMTYRVNHEVADPTYLLHYFCQGPGIDAVRAASPGSAGRNRTLGIKAFANQVIMLPSLGRQRKIAKQLSRLVVAEQLAEAQSIELSALATSTLNAAFTGQF